MSNRLACPECQEAGNDTSGNGIKIYEDGHGYCFKCNTRYQPSQLNGESVRPTERSELTLEQVNTYPTGGDPSRLVSSEVEKLYGIRHSCDVSTGKPDTVYYPTHIDGEIVGYKVRGLPKTFKKSVGKIGKTLFGNHLKGGDYLVLTEGEEDAMAAKEILSKPPAAKADCMSLPNGASFNDDLKRELVDVASVYKRVYLCLDNDTAGNKVKSEMSDFLSTITDTRIIELDPLLGKDPSDYLVEGHESSFRLAIKSAKQHEPEGIVNGRDINLDDLLTPVPEGYVIPFEGIQEKLHGIRKGEIVTVCAGSGIGKSTLVREIAKALIEQGLSVANVALEDQMNVAAQALIALDMNIPLSTFRFHPPPKVEVQPHYDKMVGNGNTFFYKHFAGITSQSLMNKLYYYARSKSVDFIVLDHLSLVISASESQNERKDIDMLMTQLARMVVETGVGLIQIVHLKRTGGDKSFAKGGEVELTDLRGSAALEQLSWTVLGLERDQQGDSRDFSRARVLKNRTFGFTGLADQLKYDGSTGRMYSVKDELEVNVSTVPLDEIEIEEPIEENEDDIYKDILSALRPNGTP